MDQDSLFDAPNGNCPKCGGTGKVYDPALDAMRICECQPVSEPVARATDPSTSWAAARSVKNLRESQQAVLRMFEHLGPLVDEELGKRYPSHQTPTWPRQSPSGLRTRRKELTRLGFVRDSGEKRRLESGRQAIVWEKVE